MSSSLAGPPNAGLPDGARVRRLLVWRAGALGDTITLFPALAALRRHYPSATMDVVGTAGHLELARHAGLADRVWDAGHPLFAGLFSRPEPPRSGPAAESLVLPPSPHLPARRRAIGGRHDTAQHEEDVPVRAGLGADLQAWLHGVDLAILWSAAATLLQANLHACGVAAPVAAPPLPGAPKRAAAYLLRCLAPLGIPSGPLLMPSLPVEQAAWHATQTSWQGIRAAHPEAPDAPIVLLHAGAGTPVKRWPLASFLALAAALHRAGLAVAWTCGPADDELFSALAGAGVPPRTILSGYGLSELCALLSRAAAVVASDSGVAHLSAAVGVPTLTLFGPTDERVWAPLGPHVTVMRYAPCRRPAGLPPSTPCPPGPCCLRDLPVDQVALLCEQLCSSR
jgi:ADP-heptose:LPS heptosyltransferase